ncbi:MAG: glycosyl hydrolase, partial [Planctomycetota bacterium]
MIAKLMWLCCAISLGHLVGTSVATAQNAPIVTAGFGSYRTSRPSFCKPLPEQIYRTPNLTGPIVTQQWWSSLIWKRFSQNMYAHPAWMRCQPEGLIVGYQGRDIHGNEQGIFGSGSLQSGDLRIGHSATKQFRDARCDDHSDWFVSALMRDDSAILKTSFGHGSPFVFCDIEGGDPEITCASPPTIWGSAREDGVMGITINGNHYGLFGSTGSRWIAQDKTTLVNQKRVGNYFSIAVLPDAKPETLQRFAEHAHAHITRTRLQFSIVGDRVETRYQFICQPREGTQRSTIFAMYPHQWKYTETPLTRLRYGSVRGEMKVGIGDQFVTSVPIQGTLPMLPAEGIRDRGKIIALLDKEANARIPPVTDTYWDGKYLGTLASLSGVAQAAGSDSAQREILGRMKQRLEQWFSARADKHRAVFYYDKAWGTLIGSRPAYGSDQPLNDHHFHYGYFIRAAAEIARHDPEWAERWAPMVQLLVRDIASPDRADKQFPHLRCFDQYAGHSWASGNADFVDGNNQESSSESLNAWYGIMLWGEIMNDPSIRDLGLFLFNTERVAVEEYWFDVSQTNYPADFPHVALGMVWGGKGAFATWFSSDIDCIHGINWLPFTPASVYLGRHPKYVLRNFRG